MLRSQCVRRGQKYSLVSARLLVSRRAQVGSMYAWKVIRCSAGTLHSTMLLCYAFAYDALRSKGGHTCSSLSSASQRTLPRYLLQCPGSTDVGKRLRAEID